MKTRKNLSTKKAALLAWNVATADQELSPLMQAIGVAISIAGSDKDFSDSVHLRKFAKRIALAKRIARGEKFIPISALRYRNNIQGEWTVTNADLHLWATFCMWLDRYCENEPTSAAFTQDITTALHVKRLWQAYERYKKTGLTKEHCALLEHMLWDVETGRGDWVSLYVQGKRPFGDSSIAMSIYQHAGWSMDWPEDTGMSPEQGERAWNLFDELVFAAPDAAKKAAAYL